MENISVSGMIRELRSKTSDIVDRFTDHLRNTITSAEAALDPKSLRSLGLGTIGLVRQHGIRITPDQLDDYIAHGNLSTAKDLQSLFKQYENTRKFSQLDLDGRMTARTGSNLVARSGANHDIVYNAPSKDSRSRHWTS